MIRPKALVPGDKVVILSTARKISAEDIQPAVQRLREWGYEVTLGKSIGAEMNQFAGNDELRTADLQNALNDPTIQAIICARGGYGTVRLLEQLDFTAFMQQPKWIVGYSDVTALHTLLNHTLEVESMHATMPINFASNTEEALKSLKSALRGSSLAYNAEPHPLNVTGNCEGEIIGGNLSMLYSMTGTQFGFRTAGRVLFLEDLDEYLYHVDRMMMNLKLAGKLSKLSGIVIGGMTKMNDNSIPFGKTAEEIIHEHTHHLGIPICFGFPAGHIDDNRTLIFGRRVQLNVAASEVKLEFDA